MESSLFLSILHRVFTLHGDDNRAFTLRLLEVKALPAFNVPNRTREPFELTFLCLGDAYPPQGSYRLTSDNGMFDGTVFLTPVGANSEGIFLQAIFN